MSGRCTIEYCEKPARSVGLCKGHYARKLRYGNALADPPKNRRTGTGSTMSNGYVRIMVDGVSKLAHQWAAEKALGRALPPEAEVHHVDFDRSNNLSVNLVICPDAAYHDLLHLRTKALIACGNPDARKCRFCKRYDDPASLFVRRSGVHHRECMNAYYRNKRKIT